MDKEALFLTGDNDTIDRMFATAELYDRGVTADEAEAILDEAK